MINESLRYVEEACTFIIPLYNEGVRGDRNEQERKNSCITSGVLPFADLLRRIVLSFFAQGSDPDCDSNYRRYWEIYRSGRPRSRSDR